MQYMCLIYTTEGTGPQPGSDDWGPFMRGYQDFTAKVTQDGKLVHADALQPTQTATTVSMRDGKMHTTDGPFAETKDLIAGWMVIDVDNYDRAVQLAGELSAAPGAGGKPIHEWLELRPFLTEPPTITD